jgi:hypothetical protein
MSDLPFADPDSVVATTVELLKARKSSRLVDTVMQAEYLFEPVLLGLGLDDETLRPFSGHSQYLGQERKTALLGEAADRRSHLSVFHAIENRS